MRRWSAFMLSGVLGLAFIVGLFIQPSDSQANPNVATWYAAYFNNVELSGEPALARSERAVNLNWLNGSPLVEVSTDDFSARWTGNFAFEAGEWRFILGADDGVRLWVGETLLVDQWQASSTYNVFTVQTTLARGVHEIRLEYFSLGKDASLNLTWEAIAGEDGENARLVSPDSNESLLRQGSTPLPGNPLGHVATGTLNVRSGPAITYARIAQIFLYQRFPILGKSGSGWYLLDLKDGRSGWVDGRFLYFTGSLSAVPTLDTGPAPAFTGATGVAADNLNIRAAPRSGADRLGTVPKGDSFAINGRNDTSAWYQIDYQGTPGWVFAPFVQTSTPVIDIPFSNAVFSAAEVPFVFAGATGRAINEANIRATPDQQRGTRLGILPANAEFEVLGRNNNSAWYLVRYQGIEGWVYAPLVELLNGVRPFNLPFVE